MDASPTVRTCRIVLAGASAECLRWQDLLEPHLSTFGALSSLGEAESWTVPAGEAGLVLECTPGAAANCGESVAGSLEIHSLVQVSSDQAPVVASWIAAVARLLADRVSLRRLVDRFGERVRKEAARLRMADLLEEANHRLQEQFVRDPLTGVPNRRRFEEHFDLCWGRAAGDGTGIGLIILDIDHFKKLNDSMGHQEGDRCLREVAQALAATLSRPNDLVARFGGEEFVAILDQCDRETVVSTAEALCESVRRLGLPHDDHPAGHVTISAGAVWTCPGLTSSAEDFLRMADEMLYQAKRTGRDRWVLGDITGPQAETQTVSKGEFDNP